MHGRGGWRVLLAGTGRHVPASRLPDVPAVEASLSELAAALTGRCGIPAANVTILQDPPTPLEFGRAVTEAAASATDVLLVYFAGHGLVGPNTDLYLATQATNSLTDGLPYSALPYTALVEAIRGSRARTVTVMLDCCFSGLAHAPSGPPALDAVFEQASLRGGYLLTSTAREEQGLARPGARHTAFTGALIRLLNEGDPTAPPRLTLDDAYRYLFRALPAEGAPRPRRRNSDRAGELVLASNPAYEVIPEPNAEPDDSTCPYRGLASFGPEDATVFFGRDQLIADITRRVVTCGGITAVVGASGCGKTSVLRAGVVPALEDAHGLTVAAITPAAVALDVSMLGMIVAARPDVVLIDQFEELFTTGMKQEPFIEALESMKAVVIAVRADFYAECTRHPQLVRRQVVIGPMSPAELTTAIEEPARAAGLRLEQGLADTILREARVQQTASLPLLQHALLRTWQRRSGDLLTLAGYRAAGSIETAVQNTAEDLYNTLPADDQARLRALLLGMVRIGDEDTRSKRPLNDLTEQDKALADTLARARLLTVDDDSVEIIHEALLDAWPRLRAWIDEDRTTLLAAQQVTDAARIWDDSGRQDTDLYQGARLELASQLSQRLGPVTRQFITRSRRVARRRATRRRAGVAVVTVLAAVAATVAAIAVHAQDVATRTTSLVHSAELAADAQALSATDPGLASQLAIAAYRTAPTPQAVTQLYSTLETPLDAVVANNSNGTLQVATQSGGPLAVTETGAGTTQIWNTDTLTLDATLHVAPAAIALAPRAAELAAPCGTAICLWSLADPRHPAALSRLPLPGRPEFSAMAINQGSTLLAAAASDGSTYLWSIAPPGHPRLIATLANPAGHVKPGAAGVAFDPRAPLLATTIQDGHTELWNITATPSRVATIKTGYQSVAFSPHGTYLGAVGGSNISLWNLTRPDRPVPTNLSLDCQATVTASNFEAATFSPDASQFTYGSADTSGANGAICQRNPSGNVTSTATSFGISQLGYTSSGALLSGGPDGVIRLWRDPLPQADVEPFGGDSASSSTSPDGRLMAVSDGITGTTQIWNIAGTPVRIATLGAAAGFVSFLSPETLLTVDLNDASVLLWNLKHLRHPVRLGTEYTGKQYVADNDEVSANAAGTLVAVLGLDHMLHLWRITPSGRAAEAGVVPASNASAGTAIITPSGRFALIDTARGIDCWDISDPAHPVQDGLTRLARFSYLRQGDGAGNVFAVASSDASGNSATMNVIDFGAARPRAVALPGHVGGQLAVSDNGGLLGVSGAGNNEVILWDTRDASHPVLLANVPTVPGVGGIAFDHAGDLMADWNLSTLQIWDLRNPAAPVLDGSLTLPGSQDVYYATFISTGTRLLISALTSVDVLNVDPAALAGALCAYTIKPITASQWHVYAPNIPYQPPCP